MARKRKSLAPRRRKTRRRKGRRGGKKPKIYGFSVKEWEKMSPREQFSIRVHDAAKRRGKKGTYEVRKWMAIDEGHPEWAGGSTRRKRRTTKPVRGSVDSRSLSHGRKTLNKDRPH